MSAKWANPGPRSANCSPAPTDTSLVRRSRSLRCGRRRRDLGSPCAAIYCVRLHRTPQIGIDQSVFSCRARDGPQPGAPRPRWRIPRPRFAAKRPFRPRLAGESFGFALRREAFSASSRVRGVAPAGPRSPADLATLAPFRGQVAIPRNLGGKSLPAADLPNDAADESAARVDSLAASPKRTQIREIRKIRRWGIRGAPYHPLRWS
jgi:hypothetical protein